ncbi:MAG: N-6 DNA methylase [bacterium]|nr:N-6 DNA methylase [bacterium]
MKTFTEAKNEFDSKNTSSSTLEAFLPVNLTFNKKIKIKNSLNGTNEEYYKWQFFYGLIHSGLYTKDYIGSEVSFPKGNKTSAPITLDGAIFDDTNWFKVYKEWHSTHSQSSLDWLRTHLIGVIEFKKEEGKNIEIVYNQQLKPAIKESEADYCVGFLYDTEKLFMFQRRNDKVLRLDESYNLKGPKSTTADLSLHLTDAYIKIPSYSQLIKRVTDIKIDRASRTVNDLDIVTGVFSNQINLAISDILRTLDKVSMLNQRGYEIVVQMIALKIFDEKKNEILKYYLEENERKDILKLKFYIDPNERDFSSLNDENIQNFIKRIQALKDNAQSTYKVILSNSTIDWKQEGHVAVVSSIVYNLQDYSFTRSSTTDLYQLIFYRFANAFTKSEKGQFLTPIPLINFLVDIVNPKISDSIIDPTVGSGDFLSVSYVKSSRKMEDKNIYGVDNDSQMIMLAQLNMLLNGDGNARMEFQPGFGSITHKFSSDGSLVPLITSKHKSGNWDDWDDYTELKKFDAVLTNPPFGDDRKFEPKTQTEKQIAELYELWDIARNGNSIDLGLIFLENTYRILGDNGRFGIVLSNSLAAIDRWEKARKWLVDKIRIVGVFDLPANVFADTGVNTTVIVGYKPDSKELEELNTRGYKVFAKDITKVGYEVKTIKRVKHFIPKYKIDLSTFEVEVDEEGRPLLDEEFTSTVKGFREWCLGQEESLQKVFLGE